MDRKTVIVIGHNAEDVKRMYEESILEPKRIIIIGSDSTIEQINDALTEESAYALTERMPIVEPLDKLIPTPQHDYQRFERLAKTHVDRRKLFKRTKPRKRKR